MGELRAAGLRLRLQGAGAFREAFRFVNCDLIVKFPRSKTTSEGIKHTQEEIERLRQLQKHAKLRRYLPEIFYYDRGSGVIVMRYYPEFEDYEKTADAMGEMIGKLIQAVTGVPCTDIHTENVRKGPGGRKEVILIDLGF